MKGEKIFRAVGDVSDDNLAIVEKHLDSKSARRSKTRMPAFMPLAAAVVALSIGTGLMFYFLSPEKPLIAEPGTSSAASGGETPGTSSAASGDETPGTSSAASRDEETRTLVPLLPANNDKPIFNIDDLVMGDLKFGMTVEEAVKIAGEPTRMFDNRHDGYVWTYYVNRYDYPFLRYIYESDDKRIDFSLDFTELERGSGEFLLSSASSSSYTYTRGLSNTSTKEEVFDAFKVDNAVFFKNSGYGDGVLLYGTPLNEDWTTANNGDATRGVWSLGASREARGPDFAEYSYITETNGRASISFTFYEGDYGVSVSWSFLPAWLFERDLAAGEDIDGLDGLGDDSRDLFYDLLAQKFADYHLLSAGKDGLLSADATVITVDDNGEKYITVYEYASAEDMEKDAGGIDIGGCSISSAGKRTDVSFESFPHWFKKGRIIVFYCGENDDIHKFLEANLGTEFAGYCAVNGKAAQ
ncbi:MAG: hypothetical protein LBI36_03025 [Oscillospiraceae bacterium]|jgi:hypothetical protein|nr:hypothetical protein [Oscillospiraceae bacterium]